VIQAHAGDMVDLLPRNIVTAELGSGTGMKTRLFSIGFVSARS